MSDRAGLSDASDRPPILEVDPNGKIIAVDVECNIEVFRRQMRPRRIMKARGLSGG